MKFDSESRGLSTLGFEVTEQKPNPSLANVDVNVDPAINNNVDNEAPPKYSAKMSTPNTAVINSAPMAPETSSSNDQIGRSTDFLINIERHEMREAERRGREMREDERRERYGYWFWRGIAGIVILAAVYGVLQYLTPPNTSQA